LLVLNAVMLSTALCVCPGTVISLMLLQGEKQRLFVKFIVVYVGNVIIK